MAENPPTPPVTPPTAPPVTPTAPAPGEKPAWLNDWKGPAIPEKFHKPTIADTLAEVTKSYGSLEQMVAKGRTQDTPKPGDPPAAPKAGDGVPQIDTTAPTQEPATLNEFVTSIGLDPQEIGKTFAEKGELTTEQYAKFAAKGMPRAVVDTTLTAVQTVFKSEIAAGKAEAAKVAGGEDNFNALIANARTFVPPGEIARLNKMLATGKASEMAAVARELVYFHSEHTRSGKSKPIIGGTPAPTTGSGYTKRSEWATASAKAGQARERGAPDLEIEAKLRATDTSKLT